MRIYIGKWSLLPESWEGINGLDKKKERDIRAEVTRQRQMFQWNGDPFDSYQEHELINYYKPKEFEATFNNDLYGQLNTKEYWIKIF